jgi:hypothetical protein
MYLLLTVNFLLKVLCRILILRVKSEEPHTSAQPSGDISSSLQLAPAQSVVQQAARGGAASNASYAAVDRALKRSSMHKVELVELSDDDNDIVILTETAASQAKPAPLCQQKGLYVPRFFSSK